jgi:hypothetical protein
MNAGERGKTDATLNPGAIAGTVESHGTRHSTLEFERGATNGYPWALGRGGGGGGLTRLGVGPYDQPPVGWRAIYFYVRHRQ